MSQWDCDALSPSFVCLLSRLVPHLEKIQRFGGLDPCGSVQSGANGEEVLKAVCTLSTCWSWRRNALLRGCFAPWAPLGSACCRTSSIDWRRSSSPPTQHSRSRATAPGMAPISAVSPKGSPNTGATHYRYHLQNTYTDLLVLVYSMVEPATFLRLILDSIQFPCRLFAFAWFWCFQLATLCFGSYGGGRVEGWKSFFFLFLSACFLDTDWRITAALIGQLPSPESTGARKESGLV